jgi:hypothetical protein
MDKFGLIGFRLGDLGLVPDRKSIPLALAYLQNIKVS